MKLDNINKSLLKLHDFIKSENYVGHSLYDSHNSSLPLEKLGTTPSFFINQIVKRSPVNLRGILRVPKGINPKGQSLFLHSYSKLYKKGLVDDKEIEERVNYFYNWLKGNPSKDYSGHCWGYNYFWPKRDGSHVPPYTPSVVVTGFVARSFLEYYEVFGDVTVGDVMKSCTKFVMNDVHLYKGVDGYCFSYTPVKKDLTVNANLLAAEVLLYSDYLNHEKNFKKHVDEVIKFTINHQNEDGSWYYSFDYDSRKPKKQIDFHQGYVLESLHRLIKYYERVYDCTPPDIENAIKRGLKFYRINQFNDKGFAFWRLPKVYPIDIHNQSQGVITFSSMKEYSEEGKFADSILDWTIENMQSKKGNFYYQKYPFLTNKTNYLRWNQGWMMVAISTLLANNKN